MDGEYLTAIVYQWKAMQGAKTLSVLALAVGSTGADQKSPAAANETNVAGGLLEGGQESRPFFIQDPADGLCLSGSTFKRCAVDTLWRVEGEPGRLSVRHMAVREDGETYAMCIALYNSCCCWYWSCMLQTCRQMKLTAEPLRCLVVNCQLVIAILSATLSEL